MSKVWKGVKKVFKKVVKVVKKVAPIILAAVAIYFTAGAALGFTAAWGGAGGIAAGMTSGLGTGLLGTTVTGALTSAGYGAAIGGVVSAASGGSFSKGAQSGAMTGAIAGGLVAGVGYAANAATTGAEAGGMISEIPQSAMAPVSPTLNAPIDASSGYSGPWAPGYDPAGAAAVAPPAPAAAPAATAPPVPTPSAPPPTPTSFNPSDPGFVGPPADVPGGGFGDGLKKVAGNILGKDGWLQNNQTLAGGAIAGIGAGMSANGEIEGQMAYARQRQDLISANYAGTDPGQNYRKLAGVDSRQDRYDPRTYGSWEYQYDPAQGRIIKVPVSG